MGTPFGSRFRSVLSHWIFHCELKRLYAETNSLAYTTHGNDSFLWSIAHKYDYPQFRFM